MTRRIFTIILIIIAVAVAAVIRAQIPSEDFITFASVGDLTTNWGGVSAPNAMFDIVNMLPGDVVSKTLTVQNTGSSIKPLGIRAVQTYLSGEPDFPAKLRLRILENGTEIRNYSLAGLFTESLGTGYVGFANLAPAATANYEFIVTFDPLAGNPYQENTVVFNLILGLAFEVPDQCQFLLNNPKTRFIFGTDKKETLTGGNYPNIIFGFGGDDVINGNNLEDCLIGGDGNDKLHGNNKNDFLFGGQGNDNLFGNNGTDYLDGGTGNDSCRLGESYSSCESTK